MKINIRMYFIGLFLFAWVITPAYAFELDVQKLDEQTYALVGEVGSRSKENFALNNTAGFVVTDEGVVLVSPGANVEGAKLMEAEIKKVTDKPIKSIVTIGAQDHHWMGSYYFKNKGIAIIALERTVNAQKEHVKDHQARLATLFAQAEEDIHYAWTENPIVKDSYKFTIGGVDFELIYPGNGHFSGDSVLWLPEKKVLFSGDFVFLERILGIHSFTHVKQWANSFDAQMKLKPEQVIPGHGHAASADQARKQTGDYLHWLIDKIIQSFDDMEEIGDVITRLNEESPFKSLQFHEGWNRKNINRTYLQLESMQLE